MKKGFTLIELLAVILILGIISLIAIPTVSSIIDEAKKNSYVNSSKNITKIMEDKCQINMMKNNNVNKSYRIKNNEIINDSLDAKGKLPDNGNSELDDNCQVTSYNYTYDDYCVNKISNSDEVQVYKLENGQICKHDGEEDSNIILPIESTPVTDDYNKYYSHAIDYTKYYEPYKNKIVNISYLYGHNKPEGASDSLTWDVSENQNKSIIAYLIPNNENYDLIVQSDYNIMAPRHLFNYFAFYPILETINLENFDTSNTIDMSQLFLHDYKLKEIKNMNFDTSNVYNFTNMFGSNSLESIDLSNFDTSNGQYFGGMFSNTKVKEFNIENFDLTKAIDIGWMFSSNKNLETIKLNSKSIENVEDMEAIFYGDKSLKELDLSNFNTSKVTTMERLFHDASNLKKIYVSDKWVNASNTTDMFKNCGTSSLTVK